MAQIAATLGREFGYALFSGVADLDEVALRSSLKQLVDAEILYRRGVLPNAIYSFKNALLHDTAYQPNFAARGNICTRGRRLFSHQVLRLPEHAQTVGQQTRP